MAPKSLAVIRIPLDAPPAQAEEVTRWGSAWNAGLLRFATVGDVARLGACGVGPSVVVDMIFKMARQEAEEERRAEEARRAGWSRHPPPMRERHRAAAEATRAGGAEDARPSF